MSSKTFCIHLRPKGRSFLPQRSDKISYYSILATGKTDYKKQYNYYIDAPNIEYAKQKAKEFAKTKNVYLINIREKSSRYQGVHKECNKWAAILHIKGSGGLQLRIGCFETEELAAKAYDQKAIEIYGKFAKTNFRH